MPGLKITVAKPLESFVEEQVRSGAYPDAESVVQAALIQFRDGDAARTARYHALLQEGLDDFAAGRFEAVEDVDAWMNSRGPQPPE